MSPIPDEDCHLRNVKRFSPVPGGALDLLHYYMYCHHSTTEIFREKSSDTYKHELNVLFVCLFKINSVISWRSVLLVEETGGPGENHRPVASH